MKMANTRYVFDGDKWYGYPNINGARKKAISILINHPNRKIRTIGIFKKDKFTEVGRVFEIAYGRSYEYRTFKPSVGSIHEHLTLDGKVGY